MTGAIEFLRKAKAICKVSNNCVNPKCPVFDMCNNVPLIIEDESELVREVMDYQIKEGKHV